MDREEKITRWIDGALTDAERAAFESELDHDPELRSEVEMATRLGDSLRAGLRSPAEDVPAPELFNAKLANTIRDLEEAAEASKIVPFFRAPWLVAAAACAVAAFALFVRPGGGERTMRSMAYVPDPNVTADVYYDSSAAATVIMLDGLDEIQADREVRPFSVASHEAGKDGRTVFYSDDEEPLFVMLAGRSGPFIHEL